MNDDDKTQPVPSKLESTKLIRAFILGGNATLTFKSLKTGTHFTYKIERAADKNTGKQDKPLYFVSLLVGSNNESDYKYFGLIRTPLNGVTTFEHAKEGKTSIAPDADGAKAFAWLFWQAFDKDQMPPNAECWHEGRCARCHMKLTNPNSLKWGFGPECIKHIGLICEAA